MSSPTSAIDMNSPILGILAHVQKARHTVLVTHLAMSSFNLPDRPSQPAPFNRPPPPGAPPLAPGWTEHKAPTGEHLCLGVNFK